MKKLILIIPLGILFCFALSCQKSIERAELEKMKDVTQTEEQNKAIVRQFHEALDSRDFNRFIEFFAPGAVAHGAGPHEDVTAENAVQFLEPFLQAFPDLTHSIEDIFAKGDKVVARILIQATHKGDFMGIPATGKKIKYYQITILQIIDGKIKEGWRLTDSLGMMQQLGMELKPKEAEKD
jgi:steroid delta-isomerase-like uncharacterized protein